MSVVWILGWLNVWKSKGRCRCKCVMGGYGLCCALRGEVSVEAIDDAVVMEPSIRGDSSKRC